ncbi:MAG: energy transducer TonB, partial [Candidatus Acidoferrales bacterium]
MRRAPRLVLSEAEGHLPGGKQKIQIRRLPTGGKKPRVSRFAGNPRYLSFLPGTAGGVSYNGRTMAASKGEAGPRLQVEWSRGWKDFRETLEALWTTLPVLPPRVALTAFNLPPARGWPKRAFAASAGLHILLLVSPLPAFFTWPAPRQPSGDAGRLEYVLHWTGNSAVLPPISPAEPLRPANPPSPEPEPPPGAAETAAEQTIVSHPPEPNHPRQTLQLQFGLEGVRVRAAEVQLPNLVIPPQPEATPSERLELPQLRLPEVDAPLPKSPGELALEQTQLENLYPKLAVEPGADAGPVPEVGAPPALPGGDLTLPGVIALSAQPGPPRPVLELPETNLRARFAIGTETGAGGPGAGGSGEGGGRGELQAPDIFVASVGSPPPGPVIVGPGGETSSGPPPPPSPPATTIEERARPPAQPPSRQPATERAEEMIERLSPGKRSALVNGRRVYTTYINMPNLSSRAGSWVLRFAELDDSAGPVPGGAGNGAGLEAPLVLKKIDPGYPAAARREEIEGTVFLYGIIRADGRVENVEVVRSVHALLDERAVAAFRRWRFQPGRKNGV